MLLIALCGMLLASGLMGQGSRPTPASVHPLPTTIPTAAQPLVNQNVTFTETGLASATIWFVNLSGRLASSTSTFVVFAVPNGNYSFTAGTGNSAYSAAPASGAVNVAGAPVAVPVAFILHYPVLFVASNLTNNSSWSVTLGGVQQNSSSNLVLFNEPNGTYAYSILVSGGYAAHPSNGSLKVNGTSLNVSISFTRPLYSLNFNGMGLWPPKTWGVSVYLPPVGITQVTQSSAANISFAEPNGSYFYTIFAPAGFVATPSTGWVSVSGGSRNVSVAFAPGYNVTFVENGLAPGTSWSVDLNGTGHWSTNATVQFVLTNGSYRFAFPPVMGYGHLGGVNLTVNGSGVTFRSNFTLQSGYYPVTFVQTGLPSGTIWVVQFGGFSNNSSFSIRGNSTSTMISFAEPNGSYPYRVWPSGQYAPAPAVGNVTVSGANLWVPIVFAIPPAPIYSLTFAESGLPSGTPWNVTLGIGVPRTNATVQSTTSTSLTFIEPAGRYFFGVGGAYGYSPAPAAGIVDLNGTNLTLAIAFSFAPGFYAVRFVEAGLPAGTEWNVSLSNASVGHLVAYPTNTSTIFSVPNGSFAYRVGSNCGYAPFPVCRYVASPSNGLVNVTGGAQNVTVTFSLVSYTASFIESGLPGGTSWSVDLGGSVVGSTSATVSFGEPNGSYGYLIGSVSGYSVNGSSSGNLTVNGANVSVAVTFQASMGGLYPLTFRSSGLPSGTNWSVTITAEATGLSIDSASSVTRWSDGASTVGFRVSPGSYGYTLFAPGFRGASGTVVVSDSAPATVTAGFSPASPRSPGELFGVPAPWLAVGLGGVAIAVLGTGLISYRSRLRREARGRWAAAQLLATEWEADEEGEPVPRMNP
ncbi:MAG: hypothetical protein L3K09_04160 [Thermoplasmata archaeon]|nr:hypothetical protein [Thermoplasmata archaeon]